MGMSTFDTLKFVRRLEQVGVPSDQAEAQAEVLTEALNVNLAELVTKDYLATRFANQNAEFEKRFSKIDASFRVVLWVLGINTAGILIPLIERYLVL